jgi:hypothetical protein
VPVSPSSPPAGITLGKHPAIRVPEVPVGDARDREQTVLRYDTSHIQICRSALDLGAPNARTERH